MIGVERTVGWRDLCVLEGQQTILRIHLLFKDIKRAGAEKNAGPTEIQPTAASQELKQCNRHSRAKIVKKQSNANNGEIVVAMTDENEVTLKRFYKEDGYIRLQPENDFLEPIILNNVTILGKAIGLYRKI